MAKSTPKKKQPAGREARLRAELDKGLLGAKATVAALAKTPIPAVAAATWEVLTHPDASSQTPGGRAKVRALLSALNKLAKAHPDVADAIAARKKASDTASSALPAANSPALAAIEQLRAAFRPDLTDKSRSKWENALIKRSVELFGKWNPYPVWTLADLSAAQRALKELELDAAVFWRWKPEKIADQARRLGRTPPGPADVIVPLAPPRALWAAVNDVAAQLCDPAPLLEVFRALPRAQALGAWNELARGIYEVDVDRAKEWKFAGDGGIRPFNIAFRERFAELLTGFSLHLGAEGERAAETLAGELLANRKLRTSRPVVAYVLASHAQARGETLASRWNALLVPANNPAIEAKLREMTGDARFPR